MIIANASILCHLGDIRPGGQAVKGPLSSMTVDVRLGARDI